MNAKTLEAITRHGESLLAAFPTATETNPAALCKKLRRVEVSASSIGLRLCNGPWFDGMEEWADKETEKHLSRVRNLLGITPAKSEEIGLFINRDPRGFALKLDDNWTRGYNAKAALRIYSDFGGYGILAPDLNS